MLLTHVKSFLFVTAISFLLIIFCINTYADNRSSQAPQKSYHAQKTNKQKENTQTKRNRTKRKQASSNQKKRSQQKPQVKLPYAQVKPHKKPVIMTPERKARKKRNNRYRSHENLNSAPTSNSSDMVKHY
jgi:uncharacterized membrane protein YhiD involved in acid resistance